MVKDLREAAGKLLKDGKVDIVIGWGKGSLPLASTPVFITSADEADQLVFDSTCGNNLAVYFTKDNKKISRDKKKVGIFVKGCDSRSLVLNITEKQLRREDVTIIGVPCEGVIDSRKVRKKAEGREVLEYSQDGDTVLIKGKDFELSLPLEELLSNACLSCLRKDAEEYDIFIGEPRKYDGKADPYSDIEEYENLSADERWKRMNEEYSKCIRCYACRNVCPSCYCNVCFVDQNDPQWIGKTPEITDTMIFHIIRNLHIAGRCVECGACERACPMDIRLLYLNRKVAKEVRDRFGSDTGTDLDQKPAMADFREDENQDFIMG